ncbi:SPFH domain-containing protein [Streptomyces flavofungini]|uniref:SPFH domain-containing protein n=1 Tax=Streptomyces flavofungini TaxID=68200 RepID=UPI0034DE2332
MSATAASRSRADQAPEGPADPADPAAGEVARPPQGVRVIHSEATTEIPLHLLFRDVPDDTEGVPLSPAAVRRGRGQVSGEQPRAAWQPGPARQPGAARPAPFVRSVPEVDVAVVERRARVLPGVAGVLGGCAGVAGCGLSLWWAGVLPEPALRLAGLSDGAGAGLGARQWASLAGSGTLGLFGFGGLARGRAGRAWVLGRYRGTVRRTGLLWVNPLLLRRRVDVRLRHWRSEPMPVVDRGGVALRVVVLVVWRVRDPARATLSVEDHEEYLRECVEATTARVLSRLPADAFQEDGQTLRDADAVGSALTRALAADAEAVGVQIFSAQPTRIEYAPEVAEAMQRRRVAALDALDARHRDTALSSVADSVEDTVSRLTTRGLVKLDDCARKALVQDLTVAFRAGQGERT